MTLKANQLPRVMLLFGFVIAGVAGLAALFLPGGLDGQRFYWIVNFAGLVVLGIAAWAFLGVVENRPEIQAAMTRVLRVFGVAFLLLGLAYLGFLYNAARFFAQESLRHQLDVVALYGGSLVGYVVAAIGFWLASRGDPDRTSPSPTDDSDLVSGSTGG